ncbi:PRC-barrel domain-containing protein [Halomonas sp. McH1-25]|uniref:PRC-barrel domain-containing protein n=1 Tax=unclassified Halomonas TaxID=2609666 RepID=UPI001EF43178|nr:MULTISPECIES: PRC-barrel domain-containing protein [unclassified Halomonas]MCG7601222.1 PRC-barrel domain-containing protein [Halomonas sp. McH1-25]MCP1341912.1 PRC-barrel domain-containing protein [Halomonas sp. FL8]MCP1360177.1 PRC-barrel domain-containing protein [Halomonas sp. BBD45]MCP1367401.1 PRC-barrel domain-containing protein [Halomonas sp. BBD48]
MHFQRNVSLIALAVAAAMGVSQAQAQNDGNQSQANAQGQNNQIRAISEWNYDELYQQGGITADNLMDTEVFGETGEEIGSVENVLVTEQNQIAAIIAQVGGFWDIGDTHVLVPWDEVQLTDDGVQIPITEDNADDYGLFDTEFITKQDLSQTQQVDDDVATGNRVWKLSDLLDDYASVGQGVGYGYVDNVLFSQDGQVQAVVIESDSAYGGGPYAYPFYGYGYGWEPGYTTYSLPYEENEIGDMDVFDYEQYNGPWDN